jgi:hypothetical protein
LLALSDKAWRLWANSISFSSGMGTKGVLTVEQQQLVRSTRAARSELIAAGLWDELDNGVIRIHDWDEHNSKRDERRERDRERKRSARLSAGTSAGTSAGRSTPAAHVETVEGKEGKEPNGSFATGRVRNPVWDALVEVFGEPSTESARTLRGKVVRSLTAAGATQDEVIARARSWPRHFEGATLTETALEKHWDALGRPPLRVGAR